MFRNVLAAVDGSSRAPLVFRAALDIAERFDGVAHLFRAVDIPPEFVAAAANPPDHTREQLLRRANADLVALAAGNTRARIEAVMELAGQPWRAILRTAELLNADLIVLGSHGYGGWDRLLGTTAAKVVNHATRAVLVIHDPLQSGG